MATVTHQRHNKTGRPRTAKRSPAFYLVDGLAAKRGVRLQDLAAHAGIDRDTLYRMRNPRLSTLLKISEALDIPLGRLASRVAAVESEAAR